MENAFEREEMSVEHVQQTQNYMQQREKNMQATKRKICNIKK
jgi:hypothetical protein